ncbi:MAG: OsmC family protein [Prolixibacteraceae bacterium]|nr:OsmC family protein [Prolixibacteraceae bacterium]
MKTTDKNKELAAKIVLKNEKLLFKGIVDGNEPIMIDYIPPLGDGQGYTSLELLLLSISSCLGSALLTFLRRMNKQISHLEIKANGLRRDEHPTGFKSINIEILLTSINTNLSELDRVLKLAEETYCPVWAMLKGNVEIIINPIIISE